MSARDRWRGFWRGDTQSLIDEEVAFHLQERVEELTATGLTADDARAQAIREFGNPEQVRRDIRTIDDRRIGRVRRIEWWRDWGADVRWGLRSLRRTPLVSLTIILTLALGLGANGAIFAMLDAVYLRQPAGVTEPGGIRRMWFQMTFHGKPAPVYWPGFAYPDFAGLQTVLGDRAALAVYRQSDDVPLSREQGASTISVVYADSNYYQMLGVTPAIGRRFTADELRPGATDAVAVISDRLWHSRYAGAHSAIGQAITIGSRSFTIIGIMPPAFQGLDLHVADVWLPLTFNGRDPNWWTDSDENGLTLLLRPRAGVSETDIAERATLSLRQTRAGADSSSVASLGSLVAARGPGETAPVLALTARLAGVAAIVLLIAVANIANLLLARAAQRRREIAVRVALGVSRGRLARLLMTEALLLALLAGGAALLVAQSGGALLRNILLPGVVWPGAPVTPGVLVVTLALTLVVGLVTGLASLSAGRGGAAGVLGANSRTTTGQRTRLRHALTVVQVALSVVLLAGAGLFWSSLRHVEERDIGFAAAELAVASFHGGDRAAQGTRLPEIARQIATLPGVSAAALTSMAPLTGFAFTVFVAPASADPVKKQGAMYTTVSSGFFAATGIRMAMGSDFPPDPTGAPEVIVNTAMAEHLWGTGNPLGQCLRFGGSEECWNVRGVAVTAIMNELLEAPEPQLYFSAARHPEKTASVSAIVFRAPRGASPIVPAVRRILDDAMPGSAPWITLFGDTIAPQYRPWRLGATLFALFGALALLVAAVGIYGMMAYQVQQRAREFGIRFALGATARGVIALVLRESLAIVAGGALAGIGIALLAGRFVASLLYGVRPGNPVILGLVAGVILVIALVASLVPAWRTTRVDPVITLRSD